VTRDEIRNLIGGYATGSLSEAEKKTLFEAALDDQEMFDELVREQALKELLDQPGAKQRLIAALEPARRRGFAWGRWAWATALAMIALAVGLTSWMLLRTPKPVQIATVQVPLAPANPPLPVGAPPAPRAERVKKTKARPAEEDRKDANEPVLKKDESSSPVAESKAEAAPPPPAPQQKQQPPEPQQPQPQPQQQPQQQQKTSTQDQVQVQAQSAQAGLRDTGTSARTVGGLAGRALMAPSLAKVANLFGFDYRYEPGSLIIKTTAAGTLTVSGATCLTCDDFTGLQTTHVEKNATTGIPVNAQYAVLAITFSTQSDSEKRPATAQFTRTDHAGAITDPNPSPNSKIVLRLELR